MVLDNETRFRPPETLSIFSNTDVVVDNTNNLFINNIHDYNEL